MDTPSLLKRFLEVIHDRYLVPNFNPLMPGVSKNKAFLEFLTIFGHFFMMMMIIIVIIL